jgi:hypothetical protein
MAARPLPPAGIGEFRDSAPFNFAPALDVEAWVRETLLADGGALYNEDHRHLEFADIAFMWAASGFTKQMRRIIGQCEEVTFRCGPWQKGRQEQQMWEWFGRVPQYLITMDANFCRECSDVEFCALVEHELYHIGQQKDVFDAPAFTKDGLPKLGMRGHDVEEFVGVVRRYGVGHPDGAIAELLRAASSTPEVGQIQIARACGTCLLKAA